MTGRTLSPALPLKGRGKFWLPPHPNPLPRGERVIKVVRRPSIPQGERNVLVEEGAQVFRARRMAQLAQGLGLDLADALAGDVELLADLLQRVVGVHVDAKAHAQHLGLARGQAL